MHTFSEEVKTRFEKVFNKKQSIVLAEVLIDFHDDLVKAKDFNELKEIVKELAESQKGSEKRLTRVEAAVEELAQAQKRAEDELTRFHRSFDSKIGGLGARWGMMAESAFRNAMERILSDVGFKTERFSDIESKAFEIARKLGIEVFNDINEVR